MIEQTVGRVRHRPDHRELVVHLRQTRQVLGEFDAGNLGRDGFELAFNVVRNVFLGIPQIQVTRATLKIDHDDRLGLAPSRSTTVVSVRFAGRLSSLSLARLQLRDCCQ